MGVSGSSLLDETKSAFIKGEAEAELSRFAPFFRKQFSVTRFNQAQQDLEQQQETTTQLLRQKAPPEGGEVLYEDAVLYFDETRKWRERYVVVRATYGLELHEGLESFLKGAPAYHRLLPTGGAVLTKEEEYMQLVDRCFPDDSSVKEDFAPPPASMPGQFPVYLRLPYRRDSYFCFKQEPRQEAFISILWDCIRHQNHDFLKKSQCEVKAFLKAVQFHRESQGKFCSWEMLIGSDSRVLSNAVMERLLPVLEKELLPKLKAKKTEKKRVWFATVEAAYILVQEVLLERLSRLKDECRTSLRSQEVLIHSDMDQILRSRAQLQENVTALVSPSLELLLSEKVQPSLAPVLEELMEPISLSFSQGRELSAGLMDKVTPEVLQDNQELKKVLLALSRPRLMECYQKMATLKKQTQIREKFGFNNIQGIIHRAQNDLQQVVENACCTFESLLNKALDKDEDSAAAAVEKIRPRVLRYFDYDSSSVRKRIFEDALVQITLPFIKEQLQEQRAQLRGSADHVLLDHCDFIDIDNVYEDVLLSVLQKHISTVLKDPSRLQKFDLLSDTTDFPNRSSLSSFGSTPSSPALSTAPSPYAANHTPPPSPLIAKETDGKNVVTARVENTDLENGPGEAKVVVEEIGDVSEQTAEEIRVKTENKTEASGEEEEKMADTGGKVVAAAEVLAEGAETKMSAVQVETEQGSENVMADSGGSVVAAAVGLIEEAKAKISEIQVDSEQGGDNNMADHAEKVVAAVEVLLEEAKAKISGIQVDTEQGEGNKMADSGGKVVAAAEVRAEGAEAKLSETEVETKQGEGNKISAEKVVAAAEVIPEAADKEVVLDVNLAKEMVQDKMEDKVVEDVKKEEGEAGNEGDKMADNVEKVLVAAQVVPQRAEVETSAVQEEVTDVNEAKVVAETEQDKMEDSAERVQEETEEENQVSAGNVQNEDKKTEEQGEEEMAETATTGEVFEEEKEEEEGSDGERSTTSDVLEENSQSPLSSEEEVGQSEESISAAKEASEDSVQPPAESSPEEQRPLEEAAQRPLEEAAQRPLEEAAQRPLEEAAQRPLEEAAQPPLEEAAEERPPDCVRAIRNLVEEVIEVEELLQRYPSGVPTELDQD